MNFWEKLLAALRKPRVSTPPPPPAPTIAVSAPAEFDKGSPVTVSWEVKNATQVTARQAGFGWEVLPASGTATQTLDKTTEFTIRATGPGGTTEKSMLITMRTRSGPAPAVASFSVSPDKTAASLTTNGTDTITLTITRNGGHSTTVSISDSGLPTGVAASYPDGSSWTGSNTGTRRVVLTGSSAPDVSSDAFTITSTDGTTPDTENCTCTVTGGSGDTPAGTVLFTQTFDGGSAGSMGTWGSPTFPTSDSPQGGKMIQFQWAGGGDDDRGVALDGIKAAYSAPTKLHAGWYYKQETGFGNTGVKKTIRFRGRTAGASDIPLGSIIIQDPNNNGVGCFLFEGDDYSVSPFNIKQSGYGTSNSIFLDNNPDSCRNTWRWLEFMLDFTDRNTQRAIMWVDGTRIIDYTGDVSGTPYPSDCAIDNIFFESFFNTPAQTKKTWLDNIIVKTGYIGVP